LLFLGGVMVLDLVRFLADGRQEIVTAAYVVSDPVVPRSGPDTPFPQ
jgi:hypothetical protein